MNTMSLESRPEPARTGVWIGIAAISMSFAAYTSALIVRQGANPDWVHFNLPPILYFSTLVVLASSVTLYLASVGRPQDPQLVDLPAVSTRREFRWIYLTLGLGLLFLLGQVIAWRDLSSQGLTLASSPSSSFFYLLTAVHGLHLVGGLGGLLYVAHRIARRSAPEALRAYRAASLYWHFMAALWVYVFVLLAVRI